MTTELFKYPSTFMGVPYGHDLSQSKAAVMGIPFDCGTHPSRIGARHGPSAIREQSSLVRRYQPPHTDFDLLEHLGVVDCGDVKVVLGDIEASFAQIEQAVSKIVSAGVVPVTLGGDGAVTLPQLRAVHKHYPDLTLLHIDAHTDTYPGSGSANQRYNTATTFTRAAEEGLVDLKRAIHVGPRGTIHAQHIFDHTREMGYTLIDGAELYQRGMDEVARYIHEQLGDRPVYLCFDMDFFDPSCAPGVCAPTWGGATAREGLGFLQSLKGLNVVAVDINTVSPPHDVGGMTAFLAGTVVIECLTLLCHRRGSVV